MAGGGGKRLESALLKQSEVNTQNVSERNNGQEVVENFGELVLLCIVIQRSKMIVKHS